MTPLRPTVTAGQLTITAWTAADGDDMHQLIAANLDHLRPWMAWAANEPFSPSRRLAMLARWERYRRSGRGTIYSVRSDQTLVGGCALHRRPTLSSIVAAMSGMAVLITGVGWFAGTVQLAGGAYLVYLGLKSWRSRPSTNNNNEAYEHATHHDALSGLRLGLIVNLSNPKGIAFFVGSTPSPSPLELH